MEINGKRKRKAVLIFLIAGIILLGYGAYLLSHHEKSTTDDSASTFTVQRGDLVMSVTESGTIKARNAVEIKSQVEGSATIVSIVPEGSYVTEQDVKDGKILVELDSSGLRDNLNQQEITYNSAEADYTGDKESLTIQKNQNDSDIQQGLLNVKFGRMDLQKYLGESTANTLIDKYKTSGEIPAIAQLINDPNQLGGDSLQNYRNLTSNIDLAEEDYKRADTDFGWTQKLYEKKYVSTTDLEADRLKAKRLKVAWEQAKTSLNLFIKYEFPKQAEQLFSDYLESERQLERIYAQARSRLAQAEAKLNSSKAKYELSKERMERTQKQIDACIVRATKPGLVIYASSDRRRFGSSRTNIEIGESVRERELIMTVTNAAEKDVDVKVHETNVDKVKVGQEVKIVVDAQPDKVFIGRVRKIAPLPDPQSFFGNPDLKVYTTDVSLEGAGESIKPGMSARVEIVIAQLKDVISIPVQSVANRDEGKVCFVMDNGRPRAQVIKTGAFNDRFVQVLDGLKEGQKVLLNPPRLLMAENSKNSQDTQVAAADKNKSEDSPSQRMDTEQSDESSSKMEPSDQADSPRSRPSGNQDMMARFDKNGDGKISLAGEVPEQARQFIEPLDTNKDGFIDAKEMAAAQSRFGGGRRQGQSGPGRRQRSDGPQEQAQ